MPSNLTIAFRVDASKTIGTGHVMRCLTLADALVVAGAKCHFIMRQFPGGMEAIVRKRGHVVSMLPEMRLGEREYDIAATPHSSWLGTDWRTDANETIAVLREINSDWLVVDHYALDRKWERLAMTAAGRLLVLDDLADRPHDCDFLLDQNLGRAETDYDGLLPSHTKRLIGPEFALLRTEFQVARGKSLQRRQSGSLDSILISMGGVDHENATSSVLRALDSVDELRLTHVTVVLGSASPNIRQVSKQAELMKVSTKVYVNADNMADLMSETDLAVGAAGGTAWERCCLGVPTLMIVLAENQRSGAAALHNASAAVCLGEGVAAIESLPSALKRMAVPDELKKFSDNAARICDASGARRVTDKLFGVHYEQ